MPTRFISCPGCRGSGKLEITCVVCKGKGSVDDLRAVAANVLRAYSKYLDDDFIDPLTDALTELQEAAGLNGV